MRSIILIVSACVIATAAGFMYYRYSHTLAQTVLAEPLPPGIQLSGLDGKQHSLEEWHGKLVLVNFWATWCTPCLHEIPALAKLQQQYAAQGLQIVGPAVDDPDAVRSMVGPLAINYPVLVSATPDAMIDLMEKLGNGPGGLPFSILINPEGQVIHRQLGEFTPAELQNLVQKHLPGASS